MGHKGVKKYPDINYDFESTQFPGLYITGTLSHSLDYRKSAGGFIHGFRYNGRALARILDWKYEGVKWPSVEKNVDQLVSSIAKRFNEASGLYQMFQFFGDIMIINRETGSFKYLEEYPIKLIPQLTEKTGHEFDPSTHSLMVLTLEYGANFSKVGEDHFGDGRAHGSVDEAHESNFLHPVLYYYHDLFTEKDLSDKSKYETLPRPDGIHHILEDFTTLFDGPTSHLLPLRRFVEFHLERDLRLFLAETCTLLTLTSHVSNADINLPLHCNKYLGSQTSVFAYSEDS